jgi:hypothetical protein
MTIANESSATEIATQSDKDTWIFTYGSERLRQARVLGYECQDRYLSERIKLEYPGFAINNGVKAVKVDFPQSYEIAQSLKHDRAFVADRYINGKVIAIDNFLDRYQIVKNVRQPWYVYFTKADYYLCAIYLVISGAFGWFCF